MQSLIEQVKRLAEAQKKWGTTSCFILDANMNARFNVDFPALLAHLERTQAVVDAAQEYRQVERDIRVGSAGMLNAKLAMHALDAALSRIAALTGERKMSYEHRLVEAANGREFYDKIGREADATIAALKDDLAEIAAIIESVDMRAAATDGPVTPTLQEMTQEEISRIYAIAAKRGRRSK